MVPYDVGLKRLITERDCNSALPYGLKYCIKLWDRNGALNVSD